MSEAPPLSAAERFQPVVLVVDDDAFECKLVNQLMDKQLYDVIFASSGSKALGMLRKERPDLILMDMDMPGISGLETLRMLKASPAHSSIPVMMVTSHNERDVVVECLRAGAVDFVLKPLNREVFLGKITRFFAI